MADMRIPPNSSQTLAIAASALHAEQSRMRVIAENIANADSTATTPGGDPYQRQIPVFEPTTVVKGATGVRMAGVTLDTSDFKQEYNPNHPAADTKGYVKLPNVDSLIEALDMKTAQRAYDANINVIEAQRAMMSSTLGILKQ
jgi:flagellar basal-body rod protein FlgC